jgi:hypothetical protein
MCLDQGKVVPAEIVDHIIPHKGDINLFWLGKLQSLCATCHSSTKQQLEEHGFASDIGRDGFPTDPNHPFNLKREY